MRSLDCFAALAMTEQGQRLSNTSFRAKARNPEPRHRGTNGFSPLRMPGQAARMTAKILQTQLRILAAQFARALLRRFTLSPRGRREGRVLARTRGPLRENAHAKEPHSSIQVLPITRPSLRSGFTAYAVLSREPSSFWPPSPSRNSRTPRRLTRCRIPQELDRSNDGQDHTVLPYARLAISPQYSPALSTEPETYRRDEA